MTAWGGFGIDEDDGMCGRPGEVDQAKESAREHGMTEETEFRRRMAGMAEQIRELHIQALAEYSPVVEQIIRSGDRDASHIEWTLDGLLDFCGDASVLQLYRRLCRHYYAIDPAAAVSYVNAYREMYDAEIPPNSGSLP